MELHYPLEQAEARRWLAGAGELEVWRLTQGGCVWWCVLGSAQGSGSSGSPSSPTKETMMQETLQKMLIMMLLLICMRSVCMQRSSRPARRGWGQGLSRRHGLSVWCGLSGSGTGVRISAGGPGLRREEAARPWPCLSGLSDPGTGLQTALRPLDWMPRSLVTSARGLRWKLRRAEASSGVSGGKLVPSRAAIRK